MSWTFSTLGERWHVKKSCQNNLLPVHTSRFWWCQKSNWFTYVALIVYIHKSFCLKSGKYHFDIVFEWLLADNNGFWLILKVMPPLLCHITHIIFMCNCLNYIPTHQPAFPCHTTTSNQGRWGLTQTSSKTINYIFSHCCLFCITWQHNTFIER